MSRRLTFDPVLARKQAAAQLATLLDRFNLAQLQAQTYAITMVDFIAQVALDPTIKTEDIPVLKFKTDLAKDIIAQAYGYPATQTNVVVHRPEDLAPNSKIMADIEAAQVQAEEFRQIDTFLQQPPEQWPGWMRDRFLASGTPYAVVDAETPAVPAVPAVSEAAE